MTLKVTLRRFCVASFFSAPALLLTPMLLLALVAGCSQLVSRSVKPPEVNPAAAGKKALEMYDANGDGLLDRNELVACPGVLASLSAYDKDGDKKVSEEEVTNRLVTLYEGGVGLMNVRCHVTKGRRPLSGATVRFVPEEFLGGAVEAAEGVTDGSGFAEIAIPDDRLPASQQGLTMMQVGVYQVQIEHPKHVASGDSKPLGHEVDPASRSGAEVSFNL